MPRQYELCVGMALEDAADGDDELAPDPPVALPVDVPLPSSSDEDAYDSDETMDVAGEGCRAPPQTMASEALDDDGWSEAAAAVDAAHDASRLSYDGSSRTRRPRDSQAGTSQRGLRPRGRPRMSGIAMRPSGRTSRGRGRPPRPRDRVDVVLSSIGPDLDDADFRTALDDLAPSQQPDPLYGTQMDDSQRDDFDFDTQRDSLFGTD